MRGSNESNKFVVAVDGFSPEEKLQALGEMGAELSPTEIDEFKIALEQVLVSGTIDVTHWEPDVIRTLLIVASKSDLRITLRRGGRTISPLKFPRSELFLDYLVDEVVIGEPW